MPTARILIATIAALALTASATAQAAPTTLRLDGIGPMKLGMTATAAWQTGWLGDRATGCKLGGTPYPVTYRFTGRNAPRGLRGTAQFDHGRLRNLSFTAGARTAAGVTVGQTTSVRMVALYRAAGFRARASFDSTFQGTFTFVTRSGRQVLGGFGERAVVSLLAIPSVPVCE